MAREGEVKNLDEHDQRLVDIRQHLLPIRKSAPPFPAPPAFADHAELKGFPEAIEPVLMSLRKITKNRGSFPTDEALLKLFYLALRNISKKWTRPIRDRNAAMTRFTIGYEDRLPQQ